MNSLDKKLIFKIVVAILFACLFTTLSYCKKNVIEFKSFYITSAVWIVVLLVSIAIYSIYDKYVGTLLFILVAAHYKKFFRDPFSLKEYFVNTKYILTGQQDYATKPTRIGYTTSMYPTTTSSS